MFYREWLGTYDGCEMLPVLQRILETGPVITKEEYRRIVLKGDPNESDSYSSCKILPKDTVYQNELVPGKFICGIRGGLDFLDVQRVDPITKACPKGTDPCSGKTSPENTICYPKDQHDDFCPIIDIKIVTMEEAKAKFNTYMKLHYYDDQYLLYTRKDIDSSPITSTQVEYKPCASPFEISKNPHKRFFELEIGKESTCSALTGTHTVYDERYRDVGFQVTEWDVQNLSGVWDELQSFQWVRNDADEYIEIKKTLNYRFWIKELTPWKLSCDANEKTRTAMFNLLIPSPIYAKSKTDLNAAKFALQRITRASMLVGGIQTFISVFFTVLIGCCYKLS